MQTQGGTPFISPLEPVAQVDTKKLHGRLNIMAVILTALFLLCMGVFIFRAL